MKHPNEWTLAEIEALAIRESNSHLLECCRVTREWLLVHQKIVRAYVLPPKPAPISKPKKVRIKNVNVNSVAGVWVD